jgi:E3 ubiquitin-protein ligase UBR4
MCTYTLTGKEFTNQHWYHCHTCRMVERVGVCSICARVCHRGHDVTYSKFGNFFCDCGAKEDGSCEAMIRRSPQPSGDDKCGNDDGSDSRYRRASSPHREKGHRRTHEDPRKTLRYVLTSQLGENVYYLHAHRFINNI